MTLNNFSFVRNTNAVPFSWVTRTHTNTHTHSIPHTHTQTYQSTPTHFLLFEQISADKIEYFETAKSGKKLRKTYQVCDKHILSNHVDCNFSWVIELCFISFTITKAFLTTNPCKSLHIT